MFYDIGARAIDFTFGQWIWEGLALVGQDLAYAQVYFDGPKGVPTMHYDTIANLGWERVNGVRNDGDKYNRSIVDGSATVALRLMTEVLSFDTSLDYMRNVNAGVLAQWRGSGSPSISPEIYRDILNKAAKGRTIDGMLPGDWLFKQPVANTNGATGIYVNVMPGYNMGPPPVFPGSFQVAVFERQSGQNPNEKREIALGNLPVTLRMLDASVKTVGQAMVQTDTSGMAVATSLPPTPLLSLSGLPSGAYVVKAQATVGGKQVEGANVFMLLPQTMPEVQREDSRMFIIPVNADGTALRPELVEQLKITGGKVMATQPGVLVISAETGANVEFAVGSFRTVVSKPISVRIVPLRIP